MTLKTKRRGWPNALVAKIVEERKTMTLDALAERYDTEAAWISVLLKRGWAAAERQAKK